MTYSSHVNSEGERISIEEGTLRGEKVELLVIHDDPPPQGSGVRAPMLLDDDTRVWLASLDRDVLCKAALADWNTYRNGITDPNELAEIYAEMTGWLARAAPIQLAAFVQHRRRREQMIAEIEALEDDDDE